MGKMKQISSSQRKANVQAYETFIDEYHHQKEKAFAMFHPFSPYRSMISSLGIFILFAHSALFLVGTYLQYRCDHHFSCERTSFSDGGLGASMMFWVEHALEIFLFLELIINFRTGYCTSAGAIEMRWEQVAIKYLTSWFFLDLFLAIPWFRLFSSTVTHAAKAESDGILKTTMRHIVGAINNLWIVRFFTSVKTLKSRPPPPSFVKKLKNRIIHWLGGIGSVARTAIHAGALKLVPLFGEGIAEARSIRKFLQGFFYSTKVIILILLLLKTFQERIEHQKRMENEAAAVIGRLMRKYLARKRAEKLASEEVVDQN